MANEKPLQEHLGNAALHVLYTLFVYFLFIVPFNLWKKAVIRLSEQKESGSLQIKNIKSIWPFFSFLKAFLLEFLFDGLIFLSYAIGVALAIIIVISDGELLPFVLMLILGYYLPVILTLFRDFFQFVILLYKKILDWVRKPAQYMDLEVKNK